jgi:hypothetical protein
VNQRVHPPQRSASSSDGTCRPGQPRVRLPKRRSTGVQRILRF